MRDRSSMNHAAKRCLLQQNMKCWYLESGFIWH